MIDVELSPSPPPRATATSEALGALLIYLLTRDLPQLERELGWMLVERWTAELVTVGREDS